MNIAARILDAILPPRCDVCGERVWPDRLEIHKYAQHWGER